MRRVLLLVCVLLICGQAACGGTPLVVFEGPEGTKATFRVEVADTAEQRRWGLMYRSELDADAGMLFVFPDEKAHSFWMKNTPLSLDIIFMDGRRRVVGIVHGTIPFSTRSVGVAVPSRYVLEVRAGLARRKGIVKGDVARFERVSVRFP